MKINYYRFQKIYQKIFLKKKLQKLNIKNVLKKLNKLNNNYKTQIKILIN